MSGGTDVTTETRRALGTQSPPRGRAPAPNGKRRPPADRQAAGQSWLRPGPAPVRARPGRTGGPAGPGNPGGPGSRAARPGTQAARPGTQAARPGTRGAGLTASPLAPAECARGATAVPLSRTPFVFLIVGLLGGGLLCLLLINTVLDTGSFQITRLQQENTTLARHTQELQAQIAAQESPARLARRARRLGMTEPPLLHFLDLKKGKVESQPSHVPDVQVVPPGYSP